MAGEGVGVLTVPGASRRPAAAGAAVGEAVVGLGRFADRFRAAVLRPGHNGVFSPLSIGYAFAMLRAAAGGDTAAQLDEVFGFPAGVHEAYNALTGQLATTGEPPPLTEPAAAQDPDADEWAEPAAPIVAIANGLFLQDGFRPTEAFLRTLAECYGAPARTVDFRSGRAQEPINDWARRQTAGRVDRIVEHLDPGTVSVIANAIYLKATWQNPFNPDRTRPGPFRLAGGGTVEVPMMSGLEASLRYARGPGWQAVELPYAGGDLAMWVLVPDGDQQPDRLLAPQVLAAARDAARRGSVELLMPRWDFGTDINLLPALGGLGLTSWKNLPGIDRQAEVTAATHRANITVDEFGTEAAAVTAIAVVLTSIFEPAVTVVADHPFAFAIVHPPTGMPLFLGQVAQPS